MNEKRIQELTELTQKSIHKSVEEMMNLNRNLSYQDCTNVLLMREIAKLQLQIEEMMRRNRLF